MAEHKAVLRSHQQLAVTKLKNGSILNGNTGTGKSRTAIGYYATVCGATQDTYVDLKVKMDLYIITTSKKRDSLEWLEECSHFYISSDPESNILGQSCVIDSWNNIKKYEEVEGAFFIFDEQRISGKGEWVKTFLKIAKRNKWIVLSATPGDTWLDYLPIFMANGFYKNRTDFNMRHVVFKPYSKYPVILRYVGEDVLEKFRSRILVDMPMARETVRHEHRRRLSYDVEAVRDLQKRRWNIFEDTPINTPGEYLYVMRRIINSDPSRLNSVLSLLLEHKTAIVFYNFDFELDLLKPFLADYDQWTVGEMNGHRHDPVPDTEHWVYLVQYNSGSEGWNCIETDTMIFYSMSYSWRQTEQAKGRIDRLNTPFKELYYITLSSHSKIDKLIERALSRKLDFNASALGWLSDQG